jgi:hypothetical protein
METTPDISFEPQPAEGPLAQVTFYPDIGVVYRSAPPNGGRTMYYIQSDGQVCTRNIQTADDALWELDFLTKRHQKKAEFVFQQPTHYLSIGAVITPYTH